MAEEMFDLVFRGELVPGADLAQVKQNLARLFKMDPARVEKLFSGNTIVLKRGMTMDAAAKYRIAIKKAGARVSTVASAKSAAKAAPAGPETKAPREAAVTAAEVPAPGLTLAPVGSDLLQASERRQSPPAKVDTGSFSLRPAGDSLVDENELSRPAPVEVAEPQLGVAPPGADVLKPEERRNLPEVDLDLSHLSASQPGERLEAARPAPPPAPDVSHFSLVEER